MVCRHRDNPSLFDVVDGKPVLTEHGRAFLKQLNRYTGTAYKRHALGEWAGAEGMVWENFSDPIHVIDGPKKPDGQYDYQALGIKSYLGGLDWGYSPAPGSLSIYGRDSEKRIIRVAGVYQTHRGLDWWADRIAELDMEFGIDRIMCDPSRNDSIDNVNDRLAQRGLPRLCEPANNKKASSPTGDLAGLDLVRWGFEKDEQGIPRIRFLKNALRFGVDVELLERHHPTLGYDEIPGYVRARDSAGEVLNDRTDADCPDHFCDELRYTCAEAWKRPVRDRERPKQYGIGTLGELLGHEKEMRMSRARVRIRS
jgi:hypothetical protein